MNHYQLNYLEYQLYSVTFEGERIGTISMDGELGQPMFTYKSEDGTVKGSVPEVKDAVRALKAWRDLKNTGEETDK
jgi:hypothetical protein